MDFDTFNVIYMSGMFNKGFSLTKNNIDFIIEDRLIDMSYMFNKCLSLKKIEFFYRYKTSY